MSGTLPAATDVDGDSVAYEKASDPAHGTVTVAAGGAFNYTPSPNYSGSDSFSFRVSDGKGGVATHQMSLTIASVADTFNGTDSTDVMNPFPGADVYRARAGNDIIETGGGDDQIDGGAGIDTAAFAAATTAYRISKSGASWTVADAVGGEGVDTLNGVERLRFANTSLALDLEGNAGSVAQIIRALFGKDQLSNKTFVGIGLQLFDAGMLYADAVKLAVGTDIFAQLAGGRSNTAFVNFVYRNVIGVAPSAGDLSLYVGLLDAGGYTQDSLALAACQINFNTGSLDLTGLISTGMEFIPAS